MPRSRKGAWEPLPYIYSGLVVHPFHPSSSSQPASPFNAHKSPTTFSRPRVPSFSTTGDRDDAFYSSRTNPHEVNLDVGDEFFAFEEYRSADEGDDSVWYRGSV